MLVIGERPILPGIYFQYRTYWYRLHVGEHVGPRRSPPLDSIVFPIFLLKYCSKKNFVGTEKQYLARVVVLVLPLDGLFVNSL